MKEYDVFVNGRKYHVRKESDDTAIVTIPAGSIQRQGDPGKCSFGQKLGECEPWQCPERLETWMRQQDRMEEKLFNISSARDLSALAGLKARLAQRCKNHHGKGNPKPLSEKEARAVSSLKLRQKKARMKRNDRRKVRSIIAGDMERGHKTDARTEQIIREVKRREDELPKPEEGEDMEAFLKRCVLSGSPPEECKRLWSVAHPEGLEREARTGGLFDKIEDGKPADGWKDWRRRIQLEKTKG